VHVCPAFYPTRGGIEVLVESAVGELKARHGIESDVVAPRHRGERPDDAVVNGSRVHSIDLFPFVAPEEFARSFAVLFAQVRKVISASNPDVIHIHGFSPLALAAASVARTRSRPVIAHVHGEIEPGLPLHFLSLLQEANRVLAVSTPVATSVQKFTSVPLDMISIVPNGVIAPVNQVRKTPEPEVLLVGRLEPEKGFADAMEAMAEILEEIPNSKLKIIGTGYELYGLQVQADRLGIGKSVSFLGELPHSEVLKHIARALVVVVPSRTIEGFSLVAAEAASMGVPVVATRVGGLSETVQDGGTGVLVDPHSPQQISSAVLALARDPEARAEMSRTAIANAAQRFSLDRFVTELSKHYRSAIATQSH